MQTLALTRVLLGCAAARRPPVHLAPMRSLGRAALHCTRMQQYDDDTNYGMPFESRPPSEKQVQYAQRLAQQLAKPLPQEALQEMNACRDFIDECLSQAPPTERQVQYAQTIARDAGIALPDYATRNAKACSEYIDANQHLLAGRPRSYGAVESAGPARGAMGGGMGMGGGIPTDKQILYAATLARQRNLGLSAEVIADKGAMSRFIDECVAGGTPRSDPAPFGDGTAAAGAGGLGGMAAAATAAAADGASGVVGTDQAAEPAAATDTSMDELDRLFDDPLDEEDEEAGAPSGASYLSEKNVPF